MVDERAYLSAKRGVNFKRSTTRPIGSQRKHDSSPSEEYGRSPIYPPEQFHRYPWQHTEASLSVYRRRMACHAFTSEGSGHHEIIAVLSAQQSAVG